jgi:hypothetical protein
MTVKTTTRTVNDLGLDASVQYAKAQAALDPRLLIDASYVSNAAGVSVTQPYVPSEFELLFTAAPTASRALFEEPPGFAANNRGLFSYQLAPSLGSYETCADRISNVKNVDPTEAAPLTSLLDLLTEIGQIDKNIYYITGKRNEFQRG